MDCSPQLECLVGIFPDQCPGPFHPASFLRMVRPLHFPGSASQWKKGEAWIWSGSIFGKSFQMIQMTQHAGLGWRNYLLSNRMVSMSVPQPIKGRGASINPTNRFEKVALE